MRRPGRPGIGSAFALGLAASLAGALGMPASAAEPAAAAASAANPEVGAAASEARPREAAPPAPSPGGSPIAAAAAAPSADDPIAPPERAAAARAFIASIAPSSAMQSFLDDFVAAQKQEDRALGRVSVHAALLLLEPGQAPRLAHWQGLTRVYPASVIKFVYLMAAYAFQEQGLVEIDPGLDKALTRMIYHSSNTATQEVFADITDTDPGPVLSKAAYAPFREKRLLVERWLFELGVDDLHAVNPTYNGGGDLHGRDVQFLKDASVPGGLPVKGDSYPNRNAMTAVGTVELLALLATDRALTPEDSAAVRERMKRTTAKQPYLKKRIAGGAEAAGEGYVVYGKTGTWGPIYADSSFVRAPDGRDLVVAVFTDGRPAYRGDFMADLTEAAVERFLEGDDASAGEEDGAAAAPAAESAGS